MRSGEWLSEQVGTGLRFVRCEKTLESLGDALPLRHAAEVRFPPDAFRLCERELPEQEERGARSGRDPVRIPAARVEHGRARPVGGLRRDLQQASLQFERTELSEFPLFCA